MMKRAFTLVELLVVIGIMGLLGTASVGGYRQMRRGMEEKGVLQDVNTIIRATYQRAQIDRQPTAVIFWNETLRAENDSDDGNVLVVGHAVAIRRAGRITRVDGDDLVDEFADLELSNQTADNESAASRATMYLYPMHNLSQIESGSSIRRSTVDTKVRCVSETPTYVLDSTGAKTETVASLHTESRESLAKNESSGAISAYAFRLENAGGVTWKAGMAYGFEFAHLVLPHGYIFGSSYSSSSANPIYEAGAIVFDVSANAGDGMKKGGGLMGNYKKTVYALLPDSSGVLKPKEIGTTADPSEALRRR